MKRLLLFALSIFPAIAADDVVMRAMRDELERSMRKLQLETLRKPYFIAYRMLDSDSCNASASFGALLNSSCTPENRRSRYLSVEVRVGDYARDNTNFYAIRLGQSGVINFSAAGGGNTPIDENYDELRRQLWLATDSGYKQALDVYAKKMATLENRTRTGDAPDFSKEAVVNDIEIAKPAVLSRADTEAMVKSLSNLFRKTPGIDNSEVRVSTNNWLTRYVNSEGTSYTRQVAAASLIATADTQAADGLPVTDVESIQARSIAEFPSRDEIIHRIEALQTRLLNIRGAPLVERYTGPVLFENQAAAEIVSQAFAPALLGVPRLVVDDPRFEKAFTSDDGTLVEKMSGRVLPDFLSLTDNPAAREFQGKPLFAGYQVDEDGVKSRPTTLIANGILKAMLHTRALIPGTTESTASRRGPGPMPSNLLFTASKSLPAADLKAELIRMAKQRNNEFGIVVRRMGNPVLAQSLGRGRTIIMTSRGGASIEIAPLVEAYKVYPDGHEELVRNLNVIGLTLAAFKDISAVSDTPFVYTAPFRFPRFSPVTTGSFMVGAPNVISVAVPALLFDDLTLQRPTGDVPNLPFTKHPFFDRK